MVGETNELQKGRIYAVAVLNGSPYGDSEKVSHLKRRWQVEKRKLGVV